MVTMLNFNIFWFRRDLRLDDNTALRRALQENENVLPIFIFDSVILNQLQDVKDRRVAFLHSELSEIKQHLNGLGSDLLVYHGQPLEVFKKLVKEFPIVKVYANHDYEPYARQRDRLVLDFLESQGIAFHTYKDQCIFEKKEIVTNQNTIYSVYTPYKKKWLSQLSTKDYEEQSTRIFWRNFAKLKTTTYLVSLQDLGFQATDWDAPAKMWSKSAMNTYKDKRDYPGLLNGTSHLGIHLRFGTISVRSLVRQALKESAEVWLSELIWRDFFMQILWHFPKILRQSFKPQYENICWRNKKSEFERWSIGQTGYPLVDAGMRELNQTGYMHNRVRMVTASFLTKHLLTHWYLGERYFAARLLDYDLSANNGNWQWVAGTGCDAAPYFRVFNPTTQIEKFDPEYTYIKKWVPEWNTSEYPKPMVEHAFARSRAINTYKQGLNILSDSSDVLKNHLKK